MTVRAYVPATFDLLARFHAEGEVPTAGAVVAVDESEDAEYAALVEAAEVSAEMSGGGRRLGARRHRGRRRPRRRAGVVRHPGDPAPARVRSWGVR